ncbi:PIR protein [Plasmodium sp.]|nr:PIR protein [Plasmodium sp.]
MKVHYINILLFPLPLNILVINTHKKPYIIHHTQKIPTTRLLCECDLYMPNYDNDLEMKRVMQQFQDRTSQRFHEYNDHMIKNRQKCKEKCDKEIQKIILKDKLEKQMEQQLTTLETKIDTGDIPTCICEKSLADKVEKGCLRCTQNLGGIVAPSSGVLGGIGEAALSVWKPKALEAAAKYAMSEGLAAGKIAGETMGVKTVMAELEALDVLKLCPQISESFFIKTSYANSKDIANIILRHYKVMCESLNSNVDPSSACKGFQLKFRIHLSEINTYGTPAHNAIPERVGEVVAGAKEAAAKAVKDASESVTTAIKAQETNVINATYAGYEITIIASIIAILIIILIMIIIYLFLRYRRKKKMKKKLQYIKLLEE